MSGGRVVLLTGGSRGLGRTGARRLAAGGAAVIVTAREADRAAAVARALRAEVPGSRVHGVGLDLAARASVHRAAAEVLDLAPRLDALVANAAVPPPRRRTENADGHELVLATDHLGHFLLTALLLPRLRATAAAHGRARVVVVSSRLHRSGWPGPQPRFDLDDLDLRRTPYHPVRAYKRAKLANVLFARELDRRERARGVRAVALCPGFVPESADPGGWRGPAYRWVFPLLPFARSRDAAAAAYAHAVTADADGIGGLFLGDGQPIRSGRRARDDRLAADLWALSERWTGAPPAS